MIEIERNNNLNNKIFLIKLNSNFKSIIENNLIEKTFIEFYSKG